MDTSSYGTPEATNHHDNERPPPRFSTFDAAVLALLVKRTIRVSHSLSAASAPTARRGASKQQKTTAARDDLCCFCSVGGSCTVRNCPCAKAGWRGRSCDPGSCNRCSNHLRCIIGRSLPRIIINQVALPLDSKFVSDGSLSPRFPFKMLAPLW